MYIILPILVICDVSAKAPSHIWEVTKKRSLVNTLDGNSFYSVMLKNIPIKIASGILLLLSLVSSDILMFICININKNSIETAPTYTSKYDKPICNSGYYDSNITFPQPKWGA